jgi:Tol biopolymer transport system component
MYPAQADLSFTLIQMELGNGRSHLVGATGLQTGCAWFISPCKENINYYHFIITVISLMGLDCAVAQAIGGDGSNWSPDEQDCFASTRIMAAQIFITDVAGHEFQMNSEQYAYETQPSWSPDGQQILYILSSNDKQQIYIMDPVGINRRQVSEDTAYLNFRPSFSPDGKNMLYTQRLRPGSVPFLTLSPFGGDEFNEYRIGQDDPMPMQEGLISPDGLWIVFEGWTGDTGHDIYVMTVTRPGAPHHHRSAVDFDPAWSPIGQ